jgi:hypothetical protein
MGSASASASASGNFSRTAAAAALALAGALVLGACSSDGGSDSDDATPSVSASVSGPASSSGSAAPSGDLAGSWLTTAKGKAVVLMVNGTEAGLFATGGTVCNGTAGDESGMQMIHLKCTDGSKDRATGMVDSVGKTTLKVTWEGGLGAETYTKSEGGKLPSGLPTASLG